MWKFLFMWKNFGGYIFRIILFNFYFLPLRQAIHLPIWIIVRNPFRDYRHGRIVIDCDRISMAMIRIGHRHDFYYKKGISLKNDGTVIFKGKAIIGNESAIEVFPNAVLTIGDRCGISSTKIFCSVGITFGDRCSVGKECTFMDTDFHRFKNLKAGTYSTASRPIIIGERTWFAYQCLVMKGTETGPKCIFSARSVLKGKYDFPENSIAGTDLKTEFWSDGYYLDPDDNAIPEGEYTKLK